MAVFCEITWRSKTSPEKATLLGNKEQQSHKIQIECKFKIQ